MPTRDFNFCIFFIEGKKNNDYVLTVGSPFQNVLTLYTFPKEFNGTHCSRLRTFNKATFQTFSSFNFDENNRFTGKSEYYSFFYPPKEDEWGQKKMYLCETATYENGVAIKRKLFSEEGKVIHVAHIENAPPSYKGLASEGTDTELFYVLPFSGEISSQKMKHLYERAKKITKENLEHIVREEVNRKNSFTVKHAPTKDNPVILFDALHFYNGTYHYWYNCFADLLHAENAFDEMRHRKIYSAKENEYRFSNFPINGACVSEHTEPKKLPGKQYGIAGQYANLKID